MSAAASTALFKIHIGWSRSKRRSPCSWCRHFRGGCPCRSWASSIGLFGSRPFCTSAGSGTAQVLRSSLSWSTSRLLFLPKTMPITIHYSLRLGIRRSSLDEVRGLLLIVASVGFGAHLLRGRLPFALADGAPCLFARLQRQHRAEGARRCFPSG